jgi:hypothetical protein
VNLDEVFVTCLSEGTMRPSQPRRLTPQTVVVKIATSETPLPPGFSIIGEHSVERDSAPVQIFRRDIRSRLGSVVQQLRSSGILKVNHEAEAMVSKLVADSMPKATTRRFLTPRRK